jgi:hypothetical protein
MNIKTLKQAKILWSYPPENWEQLSYWWKENQPITFYSWECPPRKIDKDKKLGQFVNFDVDIKKVVIGEKLDNYTEIPRICCRKDDEKWFIKNIIWKNPKTTYIKLIADTNAFYLYPKSLIILGEKVIKKLSRKFKKELEVFSVQNVDNKFPIFILFSEIQKEYKKEYDIFFNSIYQSFDRKLQSPLASKEIICYWESRVVDHVGLPRKMVTEKKDLIKRVIASYGAEGMILSLVSKDNILPNPVWVNWEEPPFSGETTEILRDRYGLKPIPKLYFIKKQCYD